MLDPTCTLEISVSINSYMLFQKKLNAGYLVEGKPDNRSLVIMFHLRIGGDMPNTWGTWQEDLLLSILEIGLPQTDSWQLCGLNTSLVLR